MPRRKIIIPPGVWQDCRRPHRGKPARCLGTYQDFPCEHPWMVRVVVGRRPDGALIRPARAVDTFEQAAELVNELAMTEVYDGQYDPNITLGQWLTVWLKMKQQQASPLSPATLKGYVSTIGILKSDPIIRIKVRALNYGHINAMFRRMGEPQPRPPKRPFVDTEGHRRDRAERHGQYVEVRSPATLRSYQRVLRAALTEAGRFGLLEGVNPAAGTMTAIGDSKAAIVADFDPFEESEEIFEEARWSPEQVATFMKHARTDRLSVMWQIYALMGPRRGELIGTPWTRLSVARKELLIDSRVLAVDTAKAGVPAHLRVCPGCKQEHTGRIWQPGAKSNDGVRKLPISDDLMDELRQHKFVQDQERAARRAAGYNYTDHNLMFCEPDGSPIAPQSITDRFQALSAEAGLPQIRLHDLRHCAASLLLAHGVAIASVAKLTGHKIQVLENVYSHVVGEVLAPEMEEVSRRLNGIVTQAPDPAPLGGGGASVHPLRRSMQAAS